MTKSKVSFIFLNWIKQQKIKTVVAVFLAIYIVVNLIFAFIYSRLPNNSFYVSKDYVLKQWQEVKDDEATKDDTERTVVYHDFSPGDYIYFSFITAATIGYGDIYPITGWSKTVVAVQSVFSALLVAITMSVITSKLMWPNTNTIRFSQKIILNTRDRCFSVRLLNTNSIPIVNPEIRLTLSMHGVGDVIVPNLILNNGSVNLPYLGKHDVILNFGFAESPHYYKEYILILNQLCAAKKYQNTNKKTDSRFRIVLTITGSNGVQSIAEIKKYYATDFVLGSAFKAIQYEGKEKTMFGIKYVKIESSQDQFDLIVDERQFNPENRLKV